jgi:cation:H+ antiporter
MRLTIYILLFILGVVFLYLGGEGLVMGSSRLARNLGINTIVIGLTLVAFGTSTPEFVVSLFAAFKGSSDFVVGNIVGSNIFNIGILGIVSFIRPTMVNPDILRLELPVMLLFALAALPIMMTGSRISRIEGIVLHVFYVLFIVLLFRA